jgi:hypothetical protein
MEDTVATIFQPFIKYWTQLYVMGIAVMDPPQLSWNCLGAFQCENQNVPRDIDTHRQILLISGLDYSNGVSHHSRTLYQPLYPLHTLNNEHYSRLPTVPTPEYRPHLLTVQYCLVQSVQYSLYCTVQYSLY